MFCFLAAKIALTCVKSFFSFQVHSYAELFPSYLP